MDVLFCDILYKFRLTKHLSVGSVVGIS